MLNEIQEIVVHISCVHCTHVLTGRHCGGHCGKKSAQRDTGNCCTHIMCALHIHVDRSALWRPLQHKRTSKYNGTHIMCALHACVDMSALWRPLQHKRTSNYICTHIMCALHIHVDRLALWRPLRHKCSTRYRKLLYTYHVCTARMC